MASSFSERIIHILKMLLNYSENSPNWGYITIMPFCLSIKVCQSQASFNDSTIKGLGLKIVAYGPKHLDCYEKICFAFGFQNSSWF